jgi:hypothetical protein
MLLAPLAVAQQWEAGGLGGFSFNPSTTVTNSSGTATTGFKNGFLVGAFAGSDDYARLSGEASYIFRQSDSMVSSGGQEVDFAGHTQFLDFRMLVHATSRESRIRPFVAIGGGVAIYSGTGQPNAAQPLNDFVALTNTRETKPMISGAGGIKCRLSQHVGLRFEFRDYATPFPNRLIAPVPGTTVGGWAQNFVVMGGISGIF